jgi:pimeloyl-ACP methyl ester carboxylesterase
MPPAAPDESCVLIEGPWSHRYVSANGSRFHVAEAGTGPLVLLLHGFPEFWGAWEHQLSGLADAGLRAVAMDLRGYGGSDKPPRGYDGYTMAADVTGLIRALGEREAILVGSGLGGLLAWCVAALHPRSVRRLVAIAAAHPLRLRPALAANPRGHVAAGGAVLRFQLPRYEHVLTRDNAALVGRYLREWSGPSWPRTPDFASYEQRCRQAMQIPQAAFCAMEIFRWSGRSMFRLHGHRFRTQLRTLVRAPTLHLQGSADPVSLTSAAAGSGGFVADTYQWRLLDGVGHFPHREAAEVVTDEILRWAKE